MPDLALVTGASGFVGAAVARALRDAGLAVRVTARGGSDPRNLKGFDDCVTLDLADPASFAPALQGCRYLFHVAADYRLWVPDEAAMRRVNVDGTAALLRAARAAGVERSIYTSSVAALGLTADGSPADEFTPILPAHHAGAYKQSKYDAEQAVRALAAGEQNIVIVNPSTPIGPGDVKPTPTGQMILDAARGRIPAFVDTGLNIVHVDDVAQGHLLALRRGMAGQAYILGGEDLMLRDILALVARQCGRAAPKLRLPIAPLVPLAFAMEQAAKLTGKTPLMTRDVLKMARKRMFFSADRAKRELGYAPRRPELAIADALSWFRAAGRL